MKRILFLTISILLFFAQADAQKRVIDAVDHSPVAAASIFDATGNMVGFTWSDGVFRRCRNRPIPLRSAVWGTKCWSSNSPRTRLGK